MKTRNLNDLTIAQIMVIAVAVVVLTLFPLWANAQGGQSPPVPVASVAS